MRYTFTIIVSGHILKDVRKQMKNCSMPTYDDGTWEWLSQYLSQNFRLGFIELATVECDKLDKKNMKISYRVRGNINVTIDIRQRLNMLEKHPTLKPSSQMKLDDAVFSTHTGDVHIDDYRVVKVEKAA